MADESTTDTATRRRVLKGALAVGAAATATPALSGVAAAHFPLRLDIDVQPQNADNFIDLSEHDTVSVAVLPTEFLNSDGERETFDPTEEAVRYRFGSNFTVRDGSGARPIDDGEVTEVGGGHGDSREALVLDFPVGETGLEGEEETAWLHWERDESGGHGFAGVDSVRVYGDPVTRRDLFERLERLLDVRADSSENRRDSSKSGRGWSWPNRRRD